MPLEEDQSRFRRAWEAYKIERHIEPIVHYQTNWYHELTKGTPFQPWILESVHKFNYFRHPFNIWERHDNIAQRITRASHIGFYHGLINGAFNVAMDNRDKGLMSGKTRLQTLFRRSVPALFGKGVFLGLAQWASVPITVTMMEEITGEDSAFNYAVAGLSFAGVTALFGAAPMYSYATLIFMPFFFSYYKHSHVMNYYDGDRTGLVGYSLDGPSKLNDIELWERYGIDQGNNVPYFARNKEWRNRLMTPDKYGWLRPRDNPEQNDQFKWK